MPVQSRAEPDDDALITLNPYGWLREAPDVRSHAGPSSDTPDAGGETTGGAAETTDPVLGQTSTALNPALAYAEWGAARRGVADPGLFRRRAGLRGGVGLVGGGLRLLRRTDMGRGQGAFAWRDDVVTRPRMFHAPPAGTEPMHQWTPRDEGPWVASSPVRERPPPRRRFPRTQLRSLRCKRT